MNRARVAALLRELADEVESADEEAHAERPKRERPKVTVTDVDRARARRSLAKLGML